MSSTSVAIHVRRGDKAQGPVASRYIVGSQEYYDKCLDVVREKIGNNFKLFIFSDGIDWCRENLKFREPHVFVGDEHAGRHGERNMQLMSLCKHFIIPESSFSWWAAWLSQSHGKVVIVPKKMFPDPTVDTRYAHPEGWIAV